MTSNSKRFWSFLNKNKKNPDIPISMNYNSMNSTDDVVIFDLFSEYFQSTYSTCAQNLYNLSSAARKSLVFNNITMEPLEAAYNKLKISTSTRPDGIPSYFIDKCWTSLCISLLNLFNKSLISGIFPTRWKYSFIRPIHKKGSRNEVCKYRPISILNQFAKIFDSIVATVLYDFVCSEISPAQHGYFKGKSTVSNLLTFTNFIHDSFFESVQTDVVYLDFSKA